MTACTTIIKDNNNYGRGENYESCFQTKEMRHKISIMIKDYCMIKPFLAKGEKNTHYKCIRINKTLEENILYCWGLQCCNIVLVDLSVDIHQAPCSNHFFGIDITKYQCLEQFPSPKWLFPPQTAKVLITFLKNENNRKLQLLDI